MRKGDVEEHGFITPADAPASASSVRFSTGQTVRLECVNSRRFFLCPICGARRVKLYQKGNLVACRVCHGLNYRSSRKNHDQYAVVTMRAERIARKLGVTVSAPDFDKGVEKPKGMRWMTYEQLMIELRRCSIEWTKVWLADGARSGLI